MLLFVFICTLYSENTNGKINEISYFLDKDLHILFSAYMHMELAEKTVTGEISGVNRLVDAREFKYDDRVTITKNGPGYEIKIGKSKICRNKTDVVKCQDGSSVWNIEPRTFGFNISQDGLCITQIDENPLKLKRCTGEDDQLFTFKVAGGRDRCEEAALFDDEGRVEKKMIIPDIHIYPVSDVHEMGHSESIRTSEYSIASSSDALDYETTTEKETIPEIRSRQKTPVIIHEHRDSDFVLPRRKIRILRNAYINREHSKNHDVLPKHALKRHREVPVFHRHIIRKDTLPTHRYISPSYGNFSPRRQKSSDDSQKSVKVSLDLENNDLNLHLHDDPSFSDDLHLQKAPGVFVERRKHTKYKHRKENMYLERGVRNTDKFLFQ
nr:polar tube protein 4 [Antonospora locustae]